MRVTVQVLIPGNQCRFPFILYLIYSQCYFWVHDPLNILPYSTLCYSTVRGRALMAVKFKFAMKNS